MVSPSVTCGSAVTGFDIAESCLHRRVPRCLGAVWAWFSRQGDATEGLRGEK